MADETRQGNRDSGGGITPRTDRMTSQAIGEDGADDFAADVVVATDEETGVPDPGVAGSAGGGTGVGDLAGGTGIGTDDGGNDTGGGEAGR